MTQNVKMLLLALFHYLQTVKFSSNKHLYFIFKHKSCISLPIRNEIFVFFQIMEFNSLFFKKMFTFASKTDLLQNVYSLAGLGLHSFTLLDIGHSKLICTTNISPIRVKYSMWTIYFNTSIDSVVMIRSQQGQGYRADKFGISFTSLNVPQKLHLYLITLTTTTVSIASFMLIKSFQLGCHCSNGGMN